MLVVNGTDAPEVTADKNAVHVSRLACILMMHLQPDIPVCPAANIAACVLACCLHGSAQTVLHTQWRQFIMHSSVRNWMASQIGIVVHVCIPALRHRSSPQTLMTTATLGSSFKIRSRFWTPQLGVCRVRSCAACVGRTPPTWRMAAAPAQWHWCLVPPPATAMLSLSPLGSCSMAPHWMTLPPR